MAATVRIEIDGSMREVTKPELFELAKQGLVQPETRLFWGNQSTTVGTIKGIEFGTPETSDQNFELSPDVLSTVTFSKDNKKTVNEERPQGKNTQK
jgi:hypothetical protein